MSIANYVFKQDSSDVIKKLSNRKTTIVFVKTSELNEFMNYRQFIKNKNYIIVCHNSDFEFNENLFNKHRYYNDVFFSQNCTVNNPNVIPLPIGLENRVLHMNGIISRYKKLEKNTPKNPSIFFSFSIHTNTSVRLESYEYLKTIKNAVGKKNLPNKMYINEMSKHMFCFSPPGNGIDTHRTWEAISLNVIPICYRSSLIEFFVNIGLPILIIDELSDIKKLDNPHTILTLYNNIMNTSNKQASNFDFWKNLVLTRANDISKKNTKLHG